MVHLKWTWFTWYASVCNPSYELFFFVQGVEYNTQVLNMSGNVIPLLMSQQFSALGLLNLQRISMSRCGLVQIDGHAFGGLTNLVELDLSQNLLKEVKKKIPSIVFNPGLFWRMVLHQNEIKVVLLLLFLWQWWR